LFSERVQHVCGLAIRGKFTGDCFVCHNNLILSAVDGPYVFQGMENGLEVLLIMQEVLEIVPTIDN
jgi:hypothetical protein